MQFIYFSGEDELSEALAYRCVKHVLPDITFHSMRPTQGGISGVKKKFGTYVATANSFPILVMIDLDAEQCPPSVRSSLIAQHNIADLPPQLILSIVKRESESWVLGDSDGIAQYLGIPNQDITGSPEDLDDPKVAIIDLARTSAKYRDEICPSARGDAKVGPGFNFRLKEFVRHQWNVETAAERCPTLMRTLERLNNLKD